MLYRNLIFAQLFIIVCCGQLLHAQTNDSIRLREYSKILYKDTAVIIKSDTVIPQDTSIVKVKKRFPVWFYHNYIKVEDKKKVIQPVAATPSYEGKIVGDIHIRRVEPFGTSIEDTSIRAKDGATKALNIIHLNTRKRTILNNLLFETGDQLKKYTLAESERVLRSVEYILDARIYGIPRPNSDTIDIVVLEKDIFSLYLNLNPLKINEYELEIDNINVGGIGHQFRNKFIFSSERRFGYEGQYRLQNIYHTLISAELQYANTVDSHYAGIDITRDFISPKIKHAGGFKYNIRKEYFPRFDTSLEFEQSSFAFHTLDIWYGRSFSVNKYFKKFKGQSNFILSGRNELVKFFQHSSNLEDTASIWQTRNLILGKVALSQRNYRTDILVTGFGRTEDIAVGRLIEIVAGYEIGEVVNRPYAGIKLTHGYKFKKAGYLYNTFHVGSYFKNGSADQGAVRFENFYYTPLIRLPKGFKLRNLLSLNYLTLINPASSINFNLQKAGGLRGFGNSVLRGTKAVALNSTHVFYSPYKFLGFRLAFFGLVDLAYINDKDKFVSKSKPFWGLGFGIRMNNESLIFGTISVRMSFYPGAPAGESIVGFGLTINQNTRLPDIKSGKPVVIWTQRDWLD